MARLLGAWDTERLEAFLTETTIPVRIATHRGDGSLWMVTLWYRYRDGSFDCATWADADIVRFLEDDSEVAFDVSTNDPPYRGVRGNGTAAMSPDEDKVVLRSLIERYLGGTDSSLAEWLLADDREEVHIRIQPESMYSWDYADRMGGDADGST